MTEQIKIAQASPVEQEAPASLLYDIQERLDALSVKVMDAIATNGDAAVSGGHDGFFITGLTIFVLACFVGYYVVWKVTPALHSPLMSITNAISSIVIIGGILAVGALDSGFSGVLGFFAIVLASVNIFGGFVITQRMLSMFKKKDQ